METKHGISRDLMNRLHSLCSDPRSSFQLGLNNVSSRLCSCVAAAGIFIHFIILILHIYFIFVMSFYCLVIKNLLFFIFIFKIRLLLGVRMTPAQWPTLIPDIISLSSPSSPSHSLASKHVTLSVLSVLPEELESGRMTQKKKMEAKKVLQEGSKLVLELIRHILRPSGPVFPSSPPSNTTSSSSSSLSPTKRDGPLISPMLSPTGPPLYTQLDASSAPLHAAALKCLRAWVEWGVPITELLTDGGALLGN